VPGRWRHRADVGWLRRVGPRRLGRDATDRDAGQHAGERHRDTDAAGMLGMLRPVQVYHVALCPHLSKMRLYRILLPIDFDEKIKPWK